MTSVGSLSWAHTARSLVNRAQQESPGAPPGFMHHLSLCTTWVYAPPGFMHLGLYTTWVYAPPGASLVFLRPGPSFSENAQFSTKSNAISWLFRRQEPVEQPSSCARRPVLPSTVPPSETSLWTPTVSRDTGGASPSHTTCPPAGPGVLLFPPSPSPWVRVWPPPSHSSSLTSVFPLWCILHECLFH